MGLDLKLRLTGIHYEYLDGNQRVPKVKTDMGLAGIDFMVAPTLSLRLFHKNIRSILYPVLKVFPVFAYSRHKEFYFVMQPGQTARNWPSIFEPYIGYGAEICLNKQSLWGVYPKLGTQFFLTYNHGKLLDTNEKYFSIGLGVRFYYRKSLLEERAAEKARLEAAQKQREYEARNA